MAITTRYIQDIRGGAAELDVNDALRLAVTDERFAVTLAKNPESLQGPFNLQPIEVAAIREALGGLSSTAGQVKGWYE